MHKNVIPDDPTVKVLSVGYEDKHELNRQTAFNRGFVEHAGKCGCFHCGSTFAGSEVTEWLHEDGGEDTALCPYCKTDAVIVGTKVFPLSTALLSTLYMEWFDSEYKARKEAATKMPMYKNRDDYKRKGIPFLYEHDKSVKILGEIGLFKLFGDGSAWGSELPKSLVTSAPAVVMEGLSTSTHAPLKMVLFLQGSLPKTESFTHSSLGPP